ncbi:MAG: AraC family transcriptional regulator [Clostridiales bacterium]|nr:AraC family transcriptional regulator [Clostridiales bacterium]
MGLVNYFPKIQSENSLLIYVSSIGVGHNQEAITFTHPHIHFHLTISGCGIAVFNGKHHMLPVGTLLYTPPGKQIEIAPAPCGWIDNWISIEVPKNESFSMMSLKDDYIIFRPNDMSEIIKIYDNVNRYLTDHTLRGRLLAAAEAYRLMMLVNIDLESQSNVSLSEISLISDAVGYIEQHFQEKITLDMLCKVGKNVSPQYFCRVFHAHTGMRPVEYILRHRIEKAKQLLSNTELPIHEVTIQSGFESESYFYRQWKRFESISPLEYRRTHAGIFV